MDGGDKMPKGVKNTLDPPRHAEPHRALCRTQHALQDPAVQPARQRPAADLPPGARAPQQSIKSIHFNSILKQGDSRGTPLQI